MSFELTIVFTIISGICSIIMLCQLFHFIIQHKQHKDAVINNLPKKFAFVSLFGYTIFVCAAFILYVIQSLYYIPSIYINYTSYLCQLQIFNIAFFMTGKIAMYFFFMSLVYVSFRDSFLAYSAILIKSTASIFCLLMCIIGGLYMTSLYFDFLSFGDITSLSGCDKFKASRSRQIIIYSGATCDAIWSGVCLLLFYLRLKKLTNLLLLTQNMQHQETNPKQISKQKKSRSDKSDLLHSFFPIILKLTILSFFCAFSTLSLGFGLWVLYPNLSSIIDSFINAFCVYLSFSFNDKLFRCLCMPFISCKYCTNWRHVLKEANKAMTRKSKFETKSTITCTTNDVTNTPTIKTAKDENVNIHKHHMSIKLDGLRAIIYNDTPISVMDPKNGNNTPHSDEYRTEDSPHTNINIMNIDSKEIVKQAS